MKKILILVLLCTPLYAQEFQAQLNSQVYRIWYGEKGNDNPQQFAERIAQGMKKGDVINLPYEYTYASKQVYIAYIGDGIRIPVPYNTYQVLGQTDIALGKPIWIKYYVYEVTEDGKEAKVKFKKKDKSGSDLNLYGYFKRTTKKDNQIKQRIKKKLKISVEQIKF